MPQRRIRPVQPRGETYPSRHAVDLGDGEPVVREDEIRADDFWDFSRDAVLPLVFDQRGRLAAIEQLRDPRGLAAF